jgi:hypothetical protein
VLTGCKTYSIGLFLFLFCAAQVAKANPDSTLSSPAVVTVGDSVLKKPGWSRAKKAAVMSACLPGLGQAYNKKYWKIPIVYGLLGTFGYFTYTNHNTYKAYSNALRNRYDSDTTNDTFLQYSEDNLVTLKRTARRYRDLSILGASLIYLIQIVDANVDGHLANFDVDNISFHVSPMDMKAAGRVYNGVALTMKF